MDKFLQEQMDYLSLEGAEKDRINSEKESKLSQGQTSTVDTQIYDPKELKDNGYPLSEPNVQPNNHSKEGKMLYANGDPYSDNTIGRITELPPAEFMLPTTRAYVKKNAELFENLKNSKTTQDAEMGLQEAYFQYKIYEGFTDNQEEYNRIAYNTADNLERVGFGFVTQSEWDDDGIDDNGMVGLQYIMGSMIMRGAKTPEEAIRNIGETHASEEQLYGAWESANRAAHRNEDGMVNPIASTNEQAMEDPTYRGAVQTYLRAKGEMTEEGIANISPEDVLSKGKMASDMFKSNYARMAGDLISIGKHEELPLADALMYMMEVDDAMPFEGADFSRNILGLLTDPSTYLGVGLFAKGISALTGKKTAMAALKRAGLVGAGGGVMGAGYSGLYDIGMQTLEVDAGQQEGYDTSRLGKAAAIGGTVGYLLGGATSLAPEAVRATSKWFKGFKKKNTATKSKYLDPSDPMYNVEQIGISAKEDFKGVPDPLDESLDARRAAKDAKDLPDLQDSIQGEGHTLGRVGDEDVIKEPLPVVSTTMETRRRMRENDKLILQAREEIPGDIQDWIDEMLDVPGGRTSPQVKDDIRDAINDMLKNAEDYGLEDLDYIKFEEIRNIMAEEPAGFLQVIDKRRRDMMKSVPGSQTSKTDKIGDLMESAEESIKSKESKTGKLKGIDLMPEENALIKKNEAYKRNIMSLGKLRNSLEKRVREGKVTKRESEGMLFEKLSALPEDELAHVLQNQKKYRDIMNMETKSDLKAKEMADLAQIAIDKDPKLAANVERAIMGEDLVKPKYVEKPDFLKGSQDDLVELLTEYDQLVKTAGPDTFRGRELRFFVDMLEEELAERNKK